MKGLLRSPVGRPALPLARPALLLLTLVAPALVPAARAAAQVPGTQSAGWAPPSAGIQLGYDNEYREEMLGAQVRIPVHPGGWVELLPNAAMTFFPGDNAYQLNLEAVVLSSGREGGFYAGGGLGWRSAVFSADPDADRETVRTWSVVAGLKLGTVGRVIPQAEVRWIFLDEGSLDPRPVTLGIKVALW
ncbi:MAG TPA: hypothetical protein VFQ22_08785 [Longimicrobiales bacterium]|nr:hypothetical protein [Longimicrobiales bacterium]